MEPIDMAYDICRYYVLDLANDVDSALVAKIDGFRRSRNIAELTSCSRHFDWLSHTVNEWRFLRQVEAFFKKNANLSIEDVCFQAAKDSFMNSEAACSQTNLRLKKFVGYHHLLDDDYHQKISRMARYISNVLGDFHSFLHGLPFNVRVTPGATAHSSRRNSLPQLKLKMRIFATQRSSAYLKALYRFYGFREPRISAVHSNRVELVPKNWKTSRTIACEPEGNLPLQLAFDSYAKRRLRKFGIDLSDQSANRERAKEASVNDDFVTVDFSAASDTISYNTVSLVFPVEWFDYLNRVRTPGYRGVFGDGIYSKFSSMGNGSTFAIETLLFAAACNAVGSRNFLVYGDDVIIEKEFYDDFISLTRFLGFTINVDKSFHQGPFRESCGGDYFNGVDVTPVYIRGIDKRKASLCHLVNSLASLTFPGSHLMKYLFSICIENKLPLVPFNESTLSGIWINPDNARRLGILIRKDHRDFYKSYTAKYKRKAFVDSRGYYLWFLNKNSQVFFSGPWSISPSLRFNGSSDQTSSVPVFDHAYVRKRVGWIEPAGGTPDHLQWWSELFKPQRAARKRR
jgi:hypothetical protein